MKIVIISQNCYPKLGPRSHRATELAKEFSKRGHEVILYAFLGNFDYSELSEETNIQFKNIGRSKFGIPDNRGFYRKTFIIKLLKKLFRYHFEFPFIELFFLVKKILKNEENIDYLITNAHPHTIHWGAASYIKKNPLKVKFWVADCGDPFMKDPLNSHPFYFKYHEIRWCKLCNFISVPIEEAKEAYYREFLNKIIVIPQGFNFEKIRLSNYNANKIPTFAYAGKIYLDYRDPSAFLKYLSNLNYDFKFIVYTKDVPFFKPYLNILNNKLELRDYIPRNDLIFELSKMDFLINIKNNSEVQLPSKIIDYAITKKPILEITSNFKEESVFLEFIKGDYKHKKEITDINYYNITNIADNFLKIINI